MKKPPRMFLGCPLWLLQLWASGTIACGVWAHFISSKEFRLTMLESGAFLIVIVILSALGKFEPKADRDAGIDRGGQGR